MVKVSPIDPQRLAREIVATRAAYDANKDRKDRVFGTTFEDVWWERPAVRTIKRISTGDVFRSVDYNGGYPSYFTLTRGDRRLRAEYRMLYIDGHMREPIVLIGPAHPDRQPERPWTADEVQLIASFFQTRQVELRRDDVARMRSNGHAEMADAHEGGPSFRVSVLVDTQDLISTPRA